MSVVMLMMAMAKSSQGIRLATVEPFDDLCFGDWDF